MMGVVQLVFAGLSLLLFQDNEEAQFFIPAFIMLAASGIAALISKRLDFSRIGFRDALLFSTLTWAIIGILGAVPIQLITRISFTDAVFESVSAVTTTGATVLSGLDEMPKTLLMYRQFLQWLGGLGIVIFVVAVLPMLNSGGLRLLKAETPGPIKDDKLSPRIAKTSHYLWFVYVLMSALCALCYYLAGMTPYDAIAHSFTTVSTGGFSTHDASMGHFNSTAILLTADFFMLLGAINFGVHFRVLHRRQAGLYWYDEETRWFIIIVALLSLLVAFMLTQMDNYAPDTALNTAAFHLISFITSTGFAADNIGGWSPAIAFLLVFSGYLGGCAGSTAGGNKIIRVLLTCKMMLLEHKRLLHPRAVFNVMYKNKPVERAVMSATMAFMSFAAFSSLVLTMALMATGLDFWSSFTAVAACVNVLGPAFGELGSNFQPVSDTGTWILSGAMILGRLEYFTVLALFLPGYWRF